MFFLRFLYVLSLVIWLMRSFFENTPRALEEAAWIDGAGFWKALLVIVLPTAAPGLAATAILCFIYAWNDFFFALILTRTDAMTAPVAVASFSFKTWLLANLTEWQPLLAVITPSLVLLSAGIAWLAIRKNQDVNRRRATIDLIEKSESSEYYRQILKTFKAHCPEDQTPEQLARLASPSNAAQQKIRREVQQYINHYELVSIGVLGKSLHEKTYRLWMMSVFIRDWNLAANYIQRDRWKYDKEAGKWIYQKRMYEKFEALATRWAKKCDLKAVRLSKTYSNPPEIPGTVDQAVPSAEEDDAPESERPSLS